jgi:hypothetical protein
LDCFLLCLLSSRSSWTTRKSTWIASPIARLIYVEFVSTISLVSIQSLIKLAQGMHLLQNISWEQDLDRNDAKTNKENNNSWSKTQHTLYS